MAGQSWSEAHELANPPHPRARLREIWLILGVPTAFSLVRTAITLSHGAGTVVFTDARLLRTLVAEGMLAACFLPLLRRRGWTPAAIAGAPRASDVLHGTALWLGSLAAYYVVMAIAMAAVPSASTLLTESRFSGDVSMVVAMAVSILNPLFEEFLWLGYAIPAL